MPGGDDDSIRVQRCFEHFHPDNSSDLGCPSWFSRSSGFLRRAWVISIIIAVIWTIAISWTALKYTRTLLQHLRKRSQVQDMLANLAVDVASHIDPRPLRRRWHSCLTGTQGGWRHIRVDERGRRVRAPMGVAMRGPVGPRKGAALLSTCRRPACLSTHSLRPAPDVVS